MQLQPPERDARRSRFWLERKKVARFIMGQAVPNGDLNSAILSRLTGFRRGSVVSTNAIVDEVEDSFRDQKTAPELVRLVSEAAMLLGLVPVYDPARPRTAVRTGGFVRRSYFQPWMAAQMKH